MLEYIVISPAYGRDYKNGQDAIKDFRDGKDFVHDSRGTLCEGYGRYISIRDCQPSTKVEIRYNRKADLVVVEV